MGVILLLLVGVAITSFSPKYDLNTAIWPTSSAFSGPQEAAAYGEWFKTIPDDTKVFMYSPRPKIVVGFGKFSCNWCQDEIDFRETILSKGALELHSFLQSKGYEYLILNFGMDLRQFNKGFNISEEELKEKYQDIINSGLFPSAYQKDNLFVVLKVGGRK